MQETEAAPRWIRPKRWQQLTGASHGETYRAIWSGDLRAVQIGRAWYIDASEVDAYFERNGRRVIPAA